MEAGASTTDWITAVSAVAAAIATTAAAFAAWRSAVASKRAAREAAVALVKETERDAAIAVDEALRALEVDARDPDWSSRLGDVHNRWQDGAAVPAMRLRDVESRRRVQLVGRVVFLAMQAASGEHTSYAFLTVIEDARSALDAFLKSEPPPRSGFPDGEQLDKLCSLRGGGRTFEPRNEWLAKNFPGFRQLT
jgi:hypothetical protein